jgi:hypothetical protein
MEGRLGLIVGVIGVGKTNTKTYPKGQGPT